MKSILASDVFSDSVGIPTTNYLQQKKTIAGVY